MKSGLLSASMQVFATILFEAALLELKVEVCTDKSQQARQAAGVRSLALEVLAPRECHHPLAEVG